jgi:hypothetical protein
MINVYTLLQRYSSELKSYYLSRLFLLYCISSPDVLVQSNGKNKHIASTYIEVYDTENKDIKNSEKISKSQ